MTKEKAAQRLTLRRRMSAVRERRAAEVRRLLEAARAHVPRVRAARRMAHDIQRVIELLRVDALPLPS